MMEKKLKKLFEYQRFERNEHLERLISKTESRAANELSDEDLSFVNAAGEMKLAGGLGGKKKDDLPQIIGGSTASE